MDNGNSISRSFIEYCLLAACYLLCFFELLLSLIDRLLLRLKLLVQVLHRLVVGLWHCTLHYTQVLTSQTDGKIEIDKKPDGCREWQQPCWLCCNSTSWRPRYPPAFNFRIFCPNFQAFEYSTEIHISQYLVCNVVELFLQSVGSVERSKMEGNLTINTL